MTNAEQYSDSVNQTYIGNKITEDEIRKAYSILSDYKKSKDIITSRIITNEEWYQIHNYKRNASANENIEPKSGWLTNVILNKHADAMDTSPALNVLPKEENDKAEAENLSSIIPVVLENNDFEKVYSDIWYDKLKNGTGVYGVFWDSAKLDGKGDIAVECIDILNLFWQPGIKDIQDSANVFYKSLEDNKILAEKYPQVKDHLGCNGETLDFVYDKTIETSDKSVVVDWYYKKEINGKTVLHYCKFCNEVVLYATENDTALCESGLYDHGMYPFIFDALYPTKESICGFGFIDFGRSQQEYIDRIDKSILENTFFNSSPRYFINKSGSVNAEDFLNPNKHLIEVNGANLGADSIRAIDVKTMPSSIFTAKSDKVDELKEITGNRDVSTGGTSSGVTAASAIAAMQESGSKLSRDAIKGSYRAYRQLGLICIELIRQFYDTIRTFRILGKKKEMQFLSYTNAGLVPQPQGPINQFTGRPEENGVDVGYRLPTFDISVTAEKSSPYTKMSQNELALQFYNLGFFNPQMADQALTCLEMMDFDTKETIVSRIEEARNNIMSNMLSAVAGVNGLQPSPTGEAPKLEDSDESAVTAKERERVQEAVTPR